MTNQILRSGRHRGVKVDIIMEDSRVFVAKVHGIKTIFTRALTLNECERLAIAWIDGHSPLSKLTHQMERDR